MSCLVALSDESIRTYHLDHAIAMIRIGQNVWVVRARFILVVSARSYSYYMLLTHSHFALINHTMRLFCDLVNAWIGNTELLPTVFYKGSYCS